MKSMYKKLGDYIEPCDLLNDKEEITLLQGISNEKYFQACKSNTNDIDLSRYRICRKGWFAYNRATTRNGDKISIAYRDGEDCLVSPSYKCFRIKDENELNPYYLMLWFKRPQFDRYARFRSHGSAHEYFEYDEMCEVELPIPSIEEQLKIVEEYQTLEHRIELKRQINDNLEAQANTVFMDKLITYLAYEEDALPDGYIKTSLTDAASYLNGLAMQNFPPLGNDDILPVLKIRELRQGCVDAKSDKCSNTIKQEYIIHNGDVIFSWSGTLYVDLWCGGKVGLNQHLFKVSSKIYPKWFYYFWTKYHLGEFIKIADGKKTSMGHIKREDLEAARIIIPSIDDLKYIDSLISPLLEAIIRNKQEIGALSNTQEILLSTLSSR